MTSYGISVDTGGGSASSREIMSFIRDAGVFRSALDSMKGGVRSLGDSISRAAQGFSRMGDCVKGVLSALMHSYNVVQGLEDGVMNLYRYSKSWWQSFAGTLDALSADALYLKNSLGAMTAPLISALAPAIDFVTDKFVTLFNLINQVFARLTGSDTYVAARKTGEAWDAVGRRISRATSALKRYLMGFDQLNILGDSTSGGDDGDSGGGGGGGGQGVMFEEREIESGLAGFVDRLREAFLASDWQTLGTLIGEKMNELVDSVDWAGLGSKFGFCLNGAIQTAYYLLDAVNFENIGARIAEFLNNALAEIDFSTLGATVALFFTSFAETLAGFIENFDWVQLASKAAEAMNGFAAELGSRLDAIDWAGLALRLTEGINRFIADTDWALAGQTFAGRINDLLEILGTSARDFDWQAAGAALADSLNSLFRNVDWDGLGQWLNDALQGVLDFGVAFVEDFDAEGFADGIGRALARVDWDGVASKLWQLFSTALKKLGEVVGALLLGGSADVALNLSLLRKGWSTIAGWLGIESPLPALIELCKKGWTSISAFVGTAVSVLVSLTKNGFKTVGDVVGTALTVLYTLSRKDNNQTLANKIGTSLGVLYTLSKKDNNQTLAAKIGTSLSVLYTLSKHDNNQTLTSKIGTALSVAYTLTKHDKNQTLAAKIGTSLSVAVSLTTSNLSNWVKSITDAINKALKKIKGKAGGGAITNSGREIDFASGGVIRGGMARYLANVPHYAGGTTRAHGTVFVAGEAGPEIMGHINGRTEILNKSQLAQAIYSAVVAGMGQAVNALGTFLAGQMAACTNAITGTIGNMRAIRSLEYHAPVMATGSVMPYEVSAQIAKTGEDIQDTLNSNNEDLIQTIISVAGQIVAAMQVSGRNNAEGAGQGGLTVQQVIRQINQRTQMFGGSPLLG